MVTRFESFGTPHIFSIIIAVLACTVFIVVGVRTKTDKSRRNITIAFGVFIVVLRCVRYVMDIFYGTLTLSKVLSAHVCHIDLIFLAVLLIGGGSYAIRTGASKTRWADIKDMLFSFTFIVGMATGLSVVLLPGSIHADPSTARAMFFVMSHATLVVAPFYLFIVEGYRVKRKHIKYIFGGMAVFTVITYGVNILTGENYLYLMGGNEGSVLFTIQNSLGYFGYLSFLVVTACACFSATYGLSIVLAKVFKKKKI